jgi:hypothetical protein
MSAAHQPGPSKPTVGEGQNKLGMPRENSAFARALEVLDSFRSSRGLPTSPAGTPPPLIDRQQGIIPEFLPSLTNLLQHISDQPNSIKVLAGW